VEKVSQERLKLLEFIQTVISSLNTDGVMSFRTDEIVKLLEDASAEVKRLQAIEAERDRYKAALIDVLNTLPPFDGCQCMDCETIRKAQKIIEGANS
jgi:hypothetical protein